MCRTARLSLVALAAGCADPRPAAPPPEHVPDYRAGCGDVLAVRFAGRPGWDGRGCVAADGTLPLGPVGRVFADQRSLADIHQAVAAAAGLPPEAVALELVRPQAGVVFLRDGGRLRAVPHLGAEPVDQFLRRAGATAAGDVTVTRPDPLGGSPHTVPATADVRLAAGDTVTVGSGR